jgi:hypothetical protein
VNMTYFLLTRVSYVLANDEMYDHVIVIKITSSGCSLLHVNKPLLNRYILMLFSLFILICRKCWIRIWNASKSGRPPCQVAGGADDCNYLSYMIQ